MEGLCEYIAWLGKLYNEHSALRTGRYRELSLTTKQYAFARISEDEAVVVAANNDTAEAEFWIRPPFLKEEILDLQSNEKIIPEHEQLHIHVPGDGVRIFLIH